ncbi:D-lactaldehyde dehydrogenase [Hysterangium stoloniferum]|nr:D-lactaldehyde dehydrogenase [Hysterangium stoloniferum]
MPPTTPGKKVLVTGASGFIAAWVVRTLLKQGFYVRGTVRSEDKGEYLANLFKEYSDHFEYIIVEDIAKEGAFDEAVKGMDAVEHTASPFHLKAEDPNELIIPAVKGTKGILESALKYGGDIQRIVITSSMAAILQPAAHPQTFSEKDWNEISTKEVETKGKEATAIHKYRASKTLAELAAWDFVKEHKDHIKWDVVALNPPLVFGPPIHSVSTVSALNASLIDFYSIIKGHSVPTGYPAGNWVDVRDLAEAHVRAITMDKAGGERFIIGAGSFTTQDILDAIHSRPVPDRDFSNVPKGTPGAGQSAIHPAQMNTKKVKEMLGLQFTGLEKTARDTARSLLTRGW